MCVYLSLALALSRVNPLSRVNLNDQVRGLGDSRCAKQHWGDGIGGVLRVRAHESGTSADGCRGRGERKKCRRGNGIDADLLGWAGWCGASTAVGSVLAPRVNP